MKKDIFVGISDSMKQICFDLQKVSLGTQADGEDAMQESILKAYENIDTLRSRRKFKSMDLSDPGK